MFRFDLRIGSQNLIHRFSSREFLENQIDWYSRTRETGLAHHDIGADLDLCWELHILNLPASPLLLLIRAKRRP